MLVCFKRLLEIIIQRRLQRRRELQEKLVDIASERFTIALNISKNNKKSRFQQKLDIVTKSGSLAPAYEAFFHESSILGSCKQCFDKYPKLSQSFFTVLLFVSYLCVVAGIFDILDVPNPEEGFGGCMYFAVISGLTIGYGDIAPRKNMRWFMIFFVPCNVICFSRLLYKLDDVLRVRKSKKSSSGGGGGGGLVKKQSSVTSKGSSSSAYLDDNDDDLNLSSWPEDLLSVESLLDSTEEGEDITELDYLRFMLKGAGIVSQDTLDDLHDRFAQVYDHMNGMSTSSTTTEVSSHTSSPHFIDGQGSSSSNSNNNSSNSRSSIGGGISRKSISAGLSRESLRGSITSFEDNVDYDSVYSSNSRNTTGGVELKEMTSI
jgi:hypothetical protein